jgi:PPOX class probable F420-dependent enzyme
VTAARLDAPAVQRFLASRDVVVLATLQPDGAPLAMPMWFVADTGAITMLSVAGTQKVRNLRRDPRACVVAEAGTRGDVRGVTIRGRAVFLDAPAERAALVERFHGKYAPHLERLWGGRAMPPDRAMFRIAPEAVHAWGLGA